MENGGNLVSDADWRDIIDFYFQVKALVALAEISDKKQELCVSAITELRSALDHIMRVQHVAVRTGQDRNILAVTDDDPRPKVPENGDEQGDYCRSNLSKTKGHLYRAAYDSLDALVMNNLATYERLVEHFDFDDICEVLPSFPTSHARILEAQRMVVQCKMFKDIEPNDTIEQMEQKLLVNGKVVEDYLRAHKLVKDVTTEIRENSLEIRAAVRRRKKAFFMPILIGVFASLCAAIIITLAVWFAQFLPTPEQVWGESTPSNPSTVQTPRTQAPPSPGPVK